MDLLIPRKISKADFEKNWGDNEPLKSLWAFNKDYGEFVLRDPERAETEANELRSKYAEAQSKLEELKGSASLIDGLTPDDLARMRERDQNWEKMKTDQRQLIDEARREEAKTYKNTIDGLQKKLTEREKAFQDREIDRAISGALESYRLSPGGRAALPRMLREEITPEWDGDKINIQLLNEHGLARRTDKNKDMTLSDLVALFLEKYPEYLAPSSGNGGGGSRRAAGGGAGDSGNLSEDVREWSHEQKQRFIASTPNGRMRYRQLVNEQAAARAKTSLTKGDRKIVRFGK